MNMNHIKKLASKGVSVAVSTALLLSCMSVSVYAAESNTPKEEVVYINLNGDGSVKEINVVNIFNLEKDGQIVDHGSYQGLRNMTTTDEIQQSGDTVTIDAKAGKLYYEGKLDRSDMPWNISLHYYLDGKEYTAEEIAGKSGALQIIGSITENTECGGDFFDGYALQLSLTLDTKKCSNIVAQDATIANVGSDKQITYTILPGKGADFEITADVTSFECDGVSINGIPLSLDVEVDDEELMEQITELIDAIEQLDDGATELQDGVSELQDGAQTDLQSGVQELTDGAAKLYDGTAELKNGGSDLQSGAFELQNGVASLDDGIQSLNQGVTQMQDALNALYQQSPALTEGSAAFKAALGQLQAALSGVSVTTEELVTLRAASSSIKTGIDDLVNGVAALQQSVSFDVYKGVYAGVMTSNGVTMDIDTLHTSNTSTIGILQTQIEELRTQSASSPDSSALTARIAQYENIVALLKANDANISVIENYLTGINQKLSESPEGAGTENPTLMDGVKTLQTNYSYFDAQIEVLVGTLSTLAYQMGELSGAVNTLVSEYGKLDSGITEYTGAVAQIVAGYSQISDGTKQLVSGSSELRTGAKSLYSGTGELLSGIVEIYDGTGTLKDGTGTLDEGVAELLTGIAQLYDGTGELKDGTSEMRDETAGMDSEINDKIDELLNSITGGDMELTSFVSDKNENIESVQFVIQTEGIHIEEAEEVAEPETEKLNFIQKFLNLFR